VTGGGRIGRFDLARQEPAIEVWLAKRILAGWSPQAIVAVGSASSASASAVSAPGASRSSASSAET